MQFLDSCPRCLARGVPPAKELRRGEQVVHGYICRCGHRWATARHIDAYTPSPARQHRPAAA